MNKKEQKIKDRALAGFAHFGIDKIKVGKTTLETKRKCPACNTGVHFPGKLMRYNDEGILVEDDCGRCRGTGFLK